MKSFALALASVLLVFMIFEVGLRFAGYEPLDWKPPRTDVPVMSDRDADLGWVSRPGTYRYKHSGRAIQTTIRTDGSRGSISTNEADGEIWFFGCSFTQGWGLRDGEEFPALVSRDAQGWTVRNFAVPGYSTLQSQMLYERLSRELPKKPRFVVYGYADMHDGRNTAELYWLATLRRIAGENEWIEVPYARWDTETGLRTFPPKSYDVWPLSEYSALLQLLNARLAALAGIVSPDEQREVTLALLDRWQRRVDQEGGEFLTMILAAPSRVADSLPAAFESRSLPHLSCLNTGFPDPKTRLPDGHPNALVNRSWADCFGRWFDTR